MKRTLAVTAMALSLIAFGCDDEETTTPRDGAAGTGGAAGRGGSGGSTGGSGGATGGSGGATGGSGGATGGSGGATGGSGGATGGSGGATGGTGGATGGSGGSGTDAGDTGGTVDTAGETGAAVSWTAPCDNPKPGVSAAAFCAQYSIACGFGAVMGRTAEQSFAMMGDCVTRYNSYADPGTATTGKACAAYHLCQASQTGNMMTHCPHPAQAGGPCSLPAR